MTKKYHTTRNIEIVLNGNSIELEATLEYTIAQYVPAKGPSYASGGQPAEGGHTEDVWCNGIKLAGKTAECPEWLSDWLAQVADGATLYEEAMEQDKDNADRAADDRLEMAREDREYRSAHDGDKQ